MLMIAVCKEIIKWQQERIMKKKFYVTMIKYLGMELQDLYPIEDLTEWFELNKK